MHRNFGKSSVIQLTKTIQNSINLLADLFICKICFCQCSKGVKYRHIYDAKVSRYTAHTVYIYYSGPYGGKVWRGMW